MFAAARYGQFVEVAERVFHIVGIESRQRTCLGNAFGTEGKYIGQGFELYGEVAEPCRHAAERHLGEGDNCVLTALGIVVDSGAGQKVFESGAHTYWT